MHSAGYRTTGLKVRKIYRVPIFQDALSPMKEQFICAKASPFRQGTPMFMEFTDKKALHGFCRKNATCGLECIGK